MLTAAVLLSALAAGDSLSGRHLLISAHPDDETISASAILSGAGDVRILQLTDGVPVTDPDRLPKLPRRFAERTAALQAGAWTPFVIDTGIAGRASWRHPHLSDALALLTHMIADADVLWTHPYEGGHLDHDTAAWLVQTACDRRTTAPLRMEFASYHRSPDGRDRFGVFSADSTTPAVDVRLTDVRLTRKQAALQAYASQTRIVRKFPTLDVEPYRHAPRYDFTRPALAVSRWDAKGYQPTTAAWRQAVAA